MDEDGNHDWDAPGSVGEWMSRELVTAAPDTPVGELARLMREQRVRHLPIVGADGRLRGLVSNRDMLGARPQGQGAQAQGASVVASHVMTRDLMTAKPDDTLVAAGARLLEHKLGCLPVVDRGGQLVGILSESDFIRVVLASKSDAKSV